MESIAAAIKKGYSWVEIDVVSTKDNIVICSHNFDLETDTDGKGYIFDYPYDSLKNLYINSYHTRNDNYKICRLTDALDMYEESIDFNIEIKARGTFDLTTARSLNGLLKKRPYIRPVISSFSPIVILYFKIFRNNLPTALIIDNSKYLWILSIIHPDFFHVRVDLVTERIIEYSSNHHIPLVVWTVDNYLAQKACEKLPVFGIITDL